MLMSLLPLIGIGIAVLFAFIIFLAIFFRVVVATNDVHIVQSGKRSISYGRDLAAGNVYYKWPAWVPRIGVRITRFPVSVFEVKLEDYSAYDKGRVPFIIDIIAFFRITDSGMAAERVLSFSELKNQLDLILKGAIRAILASSDIEEILEGRSKFGEMFTKEVDEQLKQWGVQTVKCIELMDIRDASGSKVIDNIMAKNKSKIEMESRIAVAGNMQAAQVAEVSAVQTVEIRKVEADQVVGTRKAEKDKIVGIAGEQSKQAVKDEEKTTAEKMMNVAQVNVVRKAQIEKEAEIVKAEQEKAVTVVAADATKQKTVLIAEGDLEKAKRNAEAIKLEGDAKGAAEQAILMAPVNSQITLADKIGSNEGYQSYLINIRKVEASEAIGIEQAHALKDAEIKIIANSNGVIEGVSNAMDMLSPKGGTQLGAMIEAFANTETGAKIIKTVTEPKK